MMANFIRELYMLGGGTLKLPYHGVGSQLQLATNPAPYVLPKSKVAA